MTMCKCGSGKGFRSPADEKIVCQLSEIMQRCNKKKRETGFFQNDCDGAERGMRPSVTEARTGHGSGERSLKTK